VPSKQEIQEIINSVVINRDDIAFTHSTFLQCFLPLRPLLKGKNLYQVNHGNASLVIQSGILVDPNNPYNVEEREIPAGAKARLLFAYINDQAIRTKSPVVDMGHSLRDFMERNGVPVCGSNAKEITRQAKNIAAAYILLGKWEKKKVTQRKMEIAEGMTFWIEKNPKQGSLWQPEMELSEKYMQTLQNHKAPLDFRALVGLQGSPRAMDVYCWLAYRLKSVSVPTKIPYEALHPVFGREIKQLKHFKERFKEAVIEAHKFYPEARIELDKDYVTLCESPLSVPMDTSRRNGRLFPRK